MRLGILEEFKCAAESCPDDCCHGWQIHVDADTIAKWRSLPVEPLSQKMNSAVSAKGQDHYLQRLENGHCAFLVGGLCVIQNEYGHAYLPRTCQDYPRVTVGRASAPVASAYLSCPEIVRLMLTLAPGSKLFGHDPGDGDSPPLSALDQHYTEKLLQGFISGILGREDVSLGEALYQIAAILSGLLSADSFKRQQSQLERLVTDVEEQGRLFSSARKAWRNRQLTVNAEQAGQFWRVVLSTCRVLNESDWVKRVNNAGLMPLLEAGARSEREVYLKVMQLYKQSPAMIPEVQLGLRRYLQVKLVNHGFPLATHRSQLISTFLECAIACAQISFLMRLPGEESGVAQHALTDIIYKVERALVHNNQLPDILSRNPVLQALDNYSALFMALR